MCTGRDPLNDKTCRSSRVPADTARFSCPDTGLHCAPASGFVCFGQTSFCQMFIRGNDLFTGHLLFLSHDHLFDHLAADAAGLSGSEVTVVTVL